jgi:hypothetical protein
MVSTRLSFYPLDNDIKICVSDFIDEVTVMIKKDSRFTTKREQLLLETGIYLIFENLEYWDGDLEQYPSDIREQFKNGTFIISAIPNCFLYQ